MSVINRLVNVITIFGSGREQCAAAAEAAERWTAAFADNPELAADLIRIGELLTVQPVHMEDGVPTPLPQDPSQLAYQAGRRDMALALLSLGQMTISELNQLMESLNE
ncbi:MAG: hypothetical protein CML69_10835 [Rhodobacteraceae bacterium]|nr:hypothetical protein [Paracoccaceae bacterium]